MLGCKLLSTNDGNCTCNFTGDNWKKFPGKGYTNGCLTYINIPPITSLLKEEMLDAWKERWDMYRSDIRQALGKSRATLILGAGVSAPAKMPGWQGLISQMSGYAFQYRDYTGANPNRGAIEKATQERLLKLESELISDGLTIFNGVNVLESAQYVEQLLNDSVRGNSNYELTKAVISAIIQNSETPEEFLKQWKIDNPDENSKDLKSVASGSSLCAVAYLLQAPRGFRRALTYNYDSLVQEYLLSIFGQPLDRIITHSEGWNPMEEKDSINIFHVHGYIPRTKNCNKLPAFPRESQRIILSEDSYYDTERYEAYNWQNSIQAFYLNRDTCVFVGFSAEDYNFRRILRQMGSNRNGDIAFKRPKHYLFLTIDSIVQDTWMNMCRRHLSREKTSYEEILSDTLTLLQLQLDAKATYWAKKGFYPIWVTINDIPSLLLSLVD